MRRSPQQLVSLPEGAGHLYLKLYHKIRALILSGSWPAGTRLPSSRRLAKDLGISRNTAMLAIDQLMADGWIVARMGSGIYVSAEAPPARLAAPTGRLEPINHRPEGPQPFTLTPGAVDLFPVDQWARIQSQMWAKTGEEALHEGSGAGWEPLRRAVAAHLHAVRGLQCSPEQVIIVSSSQAAIDLSLRALTKAGDQAWMEDPGYPPARQALHANELTEISVPVDSFGLRVSEGIRLAPRARLAYVTPACQFPTCAVMSEDRRHSLLRWAEHHNAYLIEDDWDYNAYLQVTHPPEPIAARASDRIIYIHSFNRLLFPALRIAALVAPERLVGPLIEARQAIDGFTNVANQIALTEFIQRGYLASHLRVCRLAFAERRAALHHAISAYMPSFVQIDPLQAGLQVVAYLADHRDSPLAAKARRDGFTCSALSDFATDPASATQALLLGFAGFPPEVLDEATRRLAESLFEGARPSSVG